MEIIVYMGTIKYREPFLYMIGNNALLQFRTDQRY